MAAVTSWLLTTGNLGDPVCSHAARIGWERIGEIDCALLLLQTSAMVHKTSSSSGGGSGGSDSSSGGGGGGGTSAAALLNGRAMVARLNARFVTGRPSNRLEEAGVIVHAFDGDILPPGALDEDGLFASLDHWSASVINTRVPHMYLGAPEDNLHSLHAGFVISPESAASSLLCSYDHDGKTMTLDPCIRSIDGTQLETDCVPGCTGVRPSDGVRLVRQWCSINTTAQAPIYPQADSPVDDHCAWPPKALDTMMLRQESQSYWCPGKPCLADTPYNEIVLNRDALQDTWPQLVEAIYFVTGSAALSPEHAIEGERQARAAQRFLLEVHGQHVPLARVNDLSARMPFELVSEASV